MAAAALERYGRIDALVNNAGIYSSLVPKPFEQIDVDEWRKVYDVNVLGMFLATRAVVPAMRAAGYGRIVNIASGTPYKGVPFLLHYVTSKGAVIAMTRAVAKEVGADGILVNTVAPGFTMSDGVLANQVQVEKLQEISLKARLDPARPVPGRHRRRGRVLLLARCRFHHGPVARGRRRGVLQLMATYLQVVELHGVAELPAATRALYDVHANTASFSTESELVADSDHLNFELTAEGHHLSFELVDEPAPGALMARELALPAGEYLLRCDRVDFPPGGEAFLHTHQGPGIRVLLFGSIRIETQGATHDLRARRAVVRDRARPRARVDARRRAERVRALHGAAARDPGLAVHPLRARRGPRASEVAALHGLPGRAGRAVTAGLRSGGQLLADQLALHGVELAFCVPGRELPRPARRPLHASRAACA